MTCANSAKLRKDGSADACCAVGFTNMHYLTEVTDCKQINMLLGIILVNPDPQRISWIVILLSFQKLNGIYFRIVEDPYVYICIYKKF